MAEESPSATAQEAEAPQSEGEGQGDAGSQPSHTYEELHAMTVAQLREIASGLDHEAVQGHSQLNKEHLLPKICEALGIVAHEHHVVVGDIDKAAIKAKIRALKKDRDALAGSGDRKRRKPILREIHTLKRELRKAMV